MTGNGTPTEAPRPHLQSLVHHAGGRSFNPEACTNFIALFTQQVTVKTAKAAAELLLMSKQADTPTSASERENRISRLETIFKTVISSPKSLRQNDDTRLLPHRRKQGAMFTAGDDFFTHILPGISSQLDCLRWEDYQLVRSLRLTIKNSPTAAQSISHLVRRMIEAAQKKNKEILSSQMDKFFPHYSDGQSLDLMTFLGALENEILAHIALNPLYPYVEWSHSNDATPLTQADTDALVKALEEAGFEIMDDFGHGKSSPKVRAMTRNDNVVGIGLMANEAVYMSDHTDDLMKQIIAVGLGPGFVKVCQDCFCDPRMARIVKPPEWNEGNSGMDSIFDEIVLSRVTPESDAHPLFAYKSGKLGARRANVFPKTRQLDARNYPSYGTLQALVPKPNDTARFINTDAAGDAIDFGIAYHGQNGHIYVITANDTERTVLDIAKALGNPLFLQTMGAFQQNSISMFGKFMRALAQAPTKVAKQ